MNSKEIKKEIEILRTQLYQSERNLIIQLAKECNIYNFEISYDYDSNSEKEYFVSLINDIDISDASMNVIKLHLYQNRINNNKYLDKNFLTDSIKALLLINKMKECDFYDFCINVLMVSDYALENCARKIVTVDEFSQYI